MSTIHKLVPRRGRAEQAEMARRRELVKRAVAAKHAPVDREMDAAEEAARMTAAKVSTVRTKKAARARTIPSDARMETVRQVEPERKAARATTAAARTKSAEVAGSKPQRAAAQQATARPRKKVRVGELHIDPAHLRAHGFIDPRGDRSLLAEEMRVVKRPLLAHAMMQEGGSRDRIILVTSARPGEGKTFSSINLALSLAQERDARVVLIDADTTMRGAEQALGLNIPGPGLTEYLLGDGVSLAEILHRTNIPHLTFIGAGKVGNGNPELYASRRMAKVVESLLRADERLIIVIDAPPVLATSEALALAPLAGQTLFVVEAGATARDVVEQAVEQIAEQTDVQLMLNKATAGRAQGNYSYYYYADYNSPTPQGKARRAPWWRRLFASAPLGIGIGMWVAMASAPVALAGWVVVPRIEVASAFTDNVENEVDGQRDSDLVVKVAPGIRVEGSESRLKVVMDYALEALGFATHRKESTLRNSFDGAVRGELVDNLLYIDLQAELGDVLIDDVGPTSINEFVVSDRRVSEYSGSISPYIKRRLGDWAEVEARYQLTHLGQNDDRLADVTSSTVSASLKGLDQRSPLGWTLRGFWDKADFDKTEDEPFRDSEAIFGGVDLSYEITDRFALLGGLGYSKIEDETLDNDEQSGPYWQVGFEARPNASTRLRATGGQLFDEPNIDISGEWRPTNKLSFGANYVNRLSSRFDRFRREIVETDPFDRLADNRDEIDIVLDDILPDDAITRRGESLYQQEYLTANISSIYGRNHFRLGGIIEERDFDVSGDQSSYGVNFAWLRNLNRSTELRAGTDWRHVDFGEGDDKDELSLALALVHQLSPTATVSLGYEFDRTFAEEQRDTTTNTVFVRLRKEF
ncbi:MAG: TIGR03016 family PEP-CTERM system-associated outer membrane protein [Geminicoccaceae bacterium]